MRSVRFSERFVLPLPSTDFEGTRLVLDGGHLDLAYDYYQGDGLYRGGLRFLKARAHRHRAELYTTAAETEAAYDRLVEVEGSGWVEELRAASPVEWRNFWEMHHYMIVIDSSGCFEVICASWEPLPERRLDGQ